MKSIPSMFVAAAAALTLAACGGGSSDAPTAPPSGSAPQPVIAVGPITNFGSVVVNGVRYNTDNAQFSVSGQPGTQADLSVGHVVFVKGTVDDDGDTGTATEVWYDESVEGPVEDIDLGSGTLFVLGQRVLVTADTSFDDDFTPESLEGVSIGDIIEVSGQFDADGSIVASRIEREDDDDDEFEVYGFVSALDAASMTFNINDLVVDYSTASLEDFDDGEPAEGDFVEVKGESFGPDGELIATEVELESPLPDYDDDDDGFDDDYEVEIEGYITRFESAEDFDVSGQPVTTTSATRYEDGGAADLALNVKVEVEGRLNADGVLVADEIEFEDERERNIRIAARVDSVDADSDTVVLLGISVRVDVGTRMEDDDDDDERRLTVADILVGDYLEIRGSESADEAGVVLATRLEREDDVDDEETILQGFVESVSEPTLQILGVTIETDGNTEFEGRDDDDELSAAAFFSQVAVGDLLKAKGFESSDTTIVAEEVEFEDDD